MQPTITIGIPSSRDFSFIVRILTSIDFQGHYCKIIIARYGNSLFSNETISSLNGFEIYQVCSSNKQSTALRNKIVSECKEDYILFLDDDMIPNKNILSIANDLVCNNKQNIFQGKPYKAYNSDNWLAKMESRQYERIFNKKIQSNGIINHIDARILLAQTKLLIDIPFDERLLNGRDGHNLAERIISKNIEIRYAENLSGKHLYRDNWKSVIKQKIRQGKGRGQLLLNEKKSSKNWILFFIKDFTGHFIIPIFDLFRGNLKYDDLIYIIISHFFYWGSTMKTILTKNKM